MRAAGEVVVPRSRRRVIGERAGVRSPALPVKMPNARMLMRWIAETRGAGRGEVASSLFAGYSAAIFVKFNFSLPPRQAREKGAAAGRANYDRPWNTRKRGRRRDSSPAVEIIATWREFGIDVS